MKRRLLFVAAAVASILALSTGSVMAIPIPGTPDASNTSYDTNLPAPTALEAQTFVPTLTGSLGTVLVHTNMFVPTPTVIVQPNVTDITVNITSMSGADPGSTLATQTITPVDGGWTLVTFTAPTNVVAGTKYAIELSQGAGDTTRWDFDCAQPYGPGNALIFSTTWKSIFAFDAQDCLATFAFQTYIVVAAATPAPTHTAPPTSTAGDTGSGTPGNPSYLLIFAGLAAAASAAVFVSISRRRLTQR
jgi:hypothetical protein